MRNRPNLQWRLRSPEVVLENVSEAVGREVQPPLCTFGKGIACVCGAAPALFDVPIGFDPMTEALQGLDDG